MCKELEFSSWYSVSARDGDNVDTAGDMIVTHILSREVGLDKMASWGERGIKLSKQHQDNNKKKCCKG